MSEGKTKKSEYITYNNFIKLSIKVVGIQGDIIDNSWMR